MFFSLPWLLLGLFGVPALAAIYWLRSRARPRTVSTLFLWVDQTRPKQGGRKVQKLQTPLIFFLELLAIASIATAAAAPFVNRSQYSRPIMLVLDDSYSMQAGDPETPISRATERLKKEFQSTQYLGRVILAGSQPKFSGSIVHNSEELESTLKDWNGRAPAAALDAAIALAIELGGENTRVLVVTDHPPQGEMQSSRVEWWGFGKPLKNLAITTATRDSVPGSGETPEDRVLLEVTNHSPTPQQTELILSGAAFPTPQRQSISLAPTESSRLILNVPSEAGELRASIGADSLKIDNEAVLLSPRKRPLRVQLALSGTGPAHERFVESLTRGLEASNQVLLTEARPDLVISTDESASAEASIQIRLLKSEPSVSFEGPYVLDRSHPLTSGLSLDAVIWSAPEAAVLTGRPVISAGNRVLLADEERIGGRHHVQLALTPHLSTLRETPDWPILLTNLIRWGLSMVPGPAQTNLRLGQPLVATLTLEAAQSQQATLTTPDGQKQTIPLHGSEVNFTPQQTGRYTLLAGTQEIPFTCNALSSEESDLSKCETGQWGKWNDSEAFQDHRMSLSWAFLLVALGCLSAEMALMSRSGGTNT